ncbi:hypothetical protein [Sulfitobacter sp. UBA4523]|uniref:hypothetical protein n=1 Tax=Sulfitobacter sp. UBA4523 TaxID=1947584 RepID=UPI000C5E2371|nr:hypothetical protein [Sulfitobacter sp. UBA4523]MAX76557.1 hypothetical protein [Roseobacter sp.]|tara:strand:- start:11951 stop:12703 length:753 start_codon:yes stop_codon:yes gene_type:complete
MTDVIAWPPFQLTGWELAEVYPQSRSVGLIEGRPRTSSAQRARRVATANITGIGTDQAGAGYVRMLNRMWAGKPNLVRVKCLSSLWYLAGGALNLRNNVLEWTDDGTDLLWTAGGVDLLWGDGAYALQGEPATDGPWHSLTVSGLPPSRILARPSEVISVTDGDTKESAYVLTVARSDASGVATIRTDKPEAFTLTGLVSIGQRENIVFEALGVPRSVQGVTGTFGYQWDFREVFEDEYNDGWTEVNPWG